MPKREDLAQVAAWLSEAYEKRIKNFPGNPRYIITELMLEAKEQTQGKGVGGVIDQKLGVDLLYIDQGDPHTDTIIYDGFMEKFLVGKLKEMLNIYQMLHDHEVKGTH